MKRRLFILISAIVFASASYILGWSSIFVVDSVEITGTETKLNPGVSTGEKLARVETRAVAAKFENLDWVEDAKVTRNWISGKVTIEVTERTPLARFNNIAIDSKGKSFVLRETPTAPLVLVEASDLESAIKAVTFLTSLPVDLKSALTVIKVRSSGSLVLEVNNSGKQLEIRWGSDSDNELKIKVYKALIALPENADIKRIDVSAPHAPIVK
jgi:cell division septal protein FtsQ